MRILHVDPAPTWRGGERQVFWLAEGLRTRGQDVQVVAAPESMLATRSRRAGISTREIAMSGDLDLRAAWRLSRLIREWRPDVLHLHTSRAHGVGGLAALGAKCPVLVTRRVELPIRGFASRWKYRVLADHYIAISGAVEESLARGGVPRDRITRIPSGVRRVQPLEPPPTDVNSDWTVGTLAAFTPQKDPKTWLETVERVLESRPQTRFVWAGDGELRRDCQVQLDQRGLSGRVELCGFLEDPEPFWRRIHAFFLPSAFEALGTVFLDSLMRAIPIVATRVGGIPEVVRHGYEGLLAPAGDSALLAEHLIQLHDDEALRARLSQAARERASEFDIDRLIDRVVELYGVLSGGAKE